MFFETVLITVVSILVLGLFGYYRYKAVKQLGQKMASDYRSAFEKSRDRH